MDKATANKIRKYAQAFKDAKERNANESDTVMFVVKFLEDVLEWDSFKGEISKEAQIKDRYCDIALKLDGNIKILVECKAAGLQSLVEKHIEQAENYASRAGVQWVVLTNGIEWRLYHLSFSENEGIVHDIAFTANIVDEIDASADELWSKLQLLTREAATNDGLGAYWSFRKTLSKGSIVKVLFTQDVLTAIRRELNRNASARLEIQDVFAAVRDALSKEALLEAGDIGITKRRKRRRKVTRTNATGQIVTEEIEEDEPVTTVTAATVQAEIQEPEPPEGPALPTSIKSTNTSS